MQARQVLARTAEKGLYPIKLIFQAEMEFLGGRSNYEDMPDVLDKKVHFFEKHDLGRPERKTPGAKIQIRPPVF
jgi:hypothetical protein